MKEFDKESLSELLDNEADDFTVRRLLKLYDENTEIAETWERYNLVQAVMHDNASLVKGSLIKRVRKQVNTENQLSALTFSNWQHAALKIVIAASVAIVSIFLVQQTFDPINSEIILADQSRVLPLSSENDAAQLSGRSELVIDAKAQELLKEYISRIEIDEDKPPRSEHIQDSPLFRLVNEIQPRDNQ